MHGTLSRTLRDFATAAAYTAPSTGLCHSLTTSTPACTEPCTVPFPDFATTLDTSLHSALHYTGPCTAPCFTPSLAHFATAQHPATSSFLLPPPDLNCKLEIAVVPPGPEQQATDQSGPPSTARPGSEWSLPDPNSKPQIECQNTCQIECPNVCWIECQIECQNICWIECQRECQNICQIECQIECQDRMSEHLSDRTSDNKKSEYMLDRMPNRMSG